MGPLHCCLFRISLSVPTKDECIKFSKETKPIRHIDIKKGAYYEQLAHEIREAKSQDVPSVS